MRVVDGRTIKAKGVLFDKIKELCPAMSEKSREGIQQEKMEKMLEQSTIYSAPDEALARTLVMDSIPVGYATVRGGPIVMDLALRHKEVLEAMKKSEVAKMDDVMIYWRFISYCCAGRLFAVTENGYIGLVSSEAKVGDSIAVFLGAEAPYILRENGESGYELVGDAYIEGIMKGEALEVRGRSSSRGDANLIEGLQEILLV